MCSKRIQYVFGVCAKLKANILNDIDNGIVRTVDEIDVLTRTAFKEVAKENRVTESTVRDACTRRMNFNAEQFYNAVKNRLRNGEQDVFLIGRMESCMTKEDNVWDIEKMMKTIF